MDKAYVIPTRHSIKIEPASADQMVKAGEHWIRITEDVGGVAQDLQEIDRHLCLNYNGLQKFYAVYWEYDNGDQYLISTYKYCDKRISNRMKQIYDERYDFVAEAEKIDAEVDAQNKHEEDEIFGDLGEQLAHAVRKDLQLDKDRAFISRGPNG